MSKQQSLSFCLLETNNTADVNPRVSRYALFWASFWSLKWEFSLICFIRGCVGAASLIQPYAIQQCLVGMEQYEALEQQRYTVVILLISAFLGKIVSIHLEAHDAK